MYKQLLYIQFKVNNIQNISLLCLLTITVLACYQVPKQSNNSTKNRNKIMQNQQNNSNKSILARGCDPLASLRASEAIPPLVGNPRYVPTTSDEDFIEKLKSQKWSLIFFAPGACRFSAAKMQIPGGNAQTKGWTLEEYRALVQKYQGNEVQIVETQDEQETVSLLKSALAKARETN